MWPRVGMPQTHDIKISFRRSLFLSLARSFALAITRTFDDDQCRLINGQMKQEQTINNICRLQGRFQVGWIADVAYEEAEEEKQVPNHSPSGCSRAFVLPWPRTGRRRHVRGIIISETLTGLEG